MKGNLRWCVVLAAGMALVTGAGGCATGLSVSVAPGVVTLAENATITYSVLPGAGTGFDALSLRITNKDHVMVATWTDLDTSPGTRTITWRAAAWVQGGKTVKAYANPGNGPYQIELRGTRHGQVWIAYAEVNTKLVVEEDLRDGDLDAPPGSVVSGLDYMIRDNGSPPHNVLKIVIRNQSNGKELVFQGDQIHVSDGPGHDPPRVYVKHVRVDDDSLNHLPSGDYQMILRDFRDDVGNFTGTIDSANQHFNSVQFTMTLR